MAGRTYTINKLGLEDLIFGTGTQVQLRNGVELVVTEINAKNLPFDEANTLQEVLDNNYPSIDAVTITTPGGKVINPAIIAVADQNTYLEIIGTDLNDVDSTIKLVAQNMTAVQTVGTVAALEKITIVANDIDSITDVASDLALGANSLIGTSLANAQAAATSASQAATSATAASDSENNASTSASAAATSASNASNSASSAATSESNAANSASSAEASALVSQGYADSINPGVITNALAPNSGYTRVSKKLDNFVFQKSSSFLNKVADKNRFVKFGEKIIDTYTHSSYDATKGGVVAQFQVPEVTEVITDGSNTTSVVVNAGEYVLVTNGTFRAKQTAPIGTSLADTAYFEDRTQIGVTNQVLAYHAYNTLTNSYEGIKTEVLFSDVSKADLLDNPTWLARNGFSKVSQFLYSKGSYLCLPIGIWQSLNKGAYHPVFNPFGTAYLYDTKVRTWYTFPGTEDVATMFGNNTRASIYQGVGFNVWNAGGNYINTGSRASSAPIRPDSKYYDICYPDQFIDVREYAKILNRDEVELIRADKIENGVEEVGVMLSSKSTGSGYWYNYGYQGAPYNGFVARIYSDDFPTIGSKVVVQIPQYLSIVDGVVAEHTVDGFKIVFTYIVGTTPTATYSTTIPLGIVTKKPILSSNTKLSIDLIGNPTNYPQILKDRLASGVGVVGINPLLVGQDGTSYISIHGNMIMSDKIITAYDRQYSNDSGATWSNTTTTPNYINNTISMYSVGRIYIASYTSKNQPLIQTAPKPVIEVEPKVIASNSHSIYKGALIGNQVAGKILVGNGTNGYESKVLENFISKFDKVVVKNGDTNDLVNGEIYWHISGAGSGDNNHLYLRVGLSSSTQYQPADFLFGDTSKWEDLGVFNHPSHSALALDNADSSASKYFKVLEQGDNGVLAGVYGEEITYDGVGEWGDTDFSQLTNGTLPDVNGGSDVKTFHGVIPINGEVK